MKKILIILTSVVILIGVSVFGYLNSKITTLEECERAGWLVRSISIYDFPDPIFNNFIEKECKLWSGKSFSK